MAVNLICNFLFIREPSLAWKLFVVLIEKCMQVKFIFGFENYKRQCGSRNMYVRNCKFRRGKIWTKIRRSIAKHFENDLYSYHFVVSVDTCFIVRDRLVHICLRTHRTRCCISPITWSTHRNIARSTYVNWVVAWTNNSVAVVVARTFAISACESNNGDFARFRNTIGNIFTASGSPFSLPRSPSFQHDTGRNCKICNSNSLVLTAHRTRY